MINFVSKVDINRMARGFKSGGRTIGTPNKITNDLREKFNTLLEQNLEILQEDLKALDPKDRVQAILHIAKFCIPVLKAVDQTNYNNEIGPAKINIIYPEDMSKADIKDDDINIRFV